jgi:hypothetical protein
MKLAALGAVLGSVYAQVTTTNARLNYQKVHALWEGNPFQYTITQKGNVLQFTHADDTNPENPPAVMMTMDDMCVKITAPCATAENLVVDGVDIKGSLQTLSQSVLDLQSQVSALKPATADASARLKFDGDAGESKLTTGDATTCTKMDGTDTCISEYIDEKIAAAIAPLAAEIAILKNVQNLAFTFGSSG